MDTLAAMIALVQPALPDWNVSVPEPAGVVAPGTAPENFPKSVLVELLPGAQAMLASPLLLVGYRLRYMAPSGIDAFAASRSVRAIGRDPQTGIRRGGRTVAGFGFMVSFAAGEAFGPTYDPDIGTPTYMANVTVTWHDTTL